MNRQSDNQALIVSYLLGALPEVDLERLETRYLEDEVLFEELQEIEDELIDDYVSGALSAEQQTQFEHYFLRSPQRREKLEFAQAMTAHALAWKKDAESAEGLSNHDAESRESIENEGKVLPFRSSSRPVPSWRQWAALAAAVLIAIGSGMLWLRNRELRRELIAAQANSTQLRQEAEAQSALALETQAQLLVEQEQMQKLEEELEQLQRSLPTEARKVVVTAILGIEYLFRGTRGGGEKKVKALEIPANARLVRLGLEFETGRFESFKITLRRADGTTAWSGGGLKPRTVGDKQRLTLAILAENLSAGSYDLTLIGVPAEGDAELVGRYYLRLERKQVTR